MTRRAGSTLPLLPIPTLPARLEPESPAAHPERPGGRERLVSRHLSRAEAAIRSLGDATPQLLRWRDDWARVLGGGGRLLVAGNGGSAALAQRVVAELVGRYRHDRPAFAAVALAADASVLTALGNDYGFEQCFARQVAALGRPGDVLLLLSTSGRSPNLLRAATSAIERGLQTQALTGAGPNPLTELVHDAVAVPAEDTAAAQEAHQVAVHIVCSLFDERIRAGG